MARRHRLTYTAHCATNEEGEKTLERPESELRDCIKHVKGGGKRKAPAKWSCSYLHFKGRTGKWSRTTPCLSSEGFSKRTPSQCSHLQQLDDTDSTVGHLSIIVLPKFCTVKNFYNYSSRSKESCYNVDFLYNWTLCLRENHIFIMFLLKIANIYNLYVSI